MAYTKFVPDKPDIADTGAVVIDNTRQNLMALRDAIVAGGFLVDWTLSVSGGTADEPDIILYSKGTERVRLSVTWGSAGGGANNPTQIIYAYSANSGGVYDTIGTLTISYDSNGNTTTTSWA